MNKVLKRLVSATTMMVMVVSISSPIFAETPHFNHSNEFLESQNVTARDLGLDPMEYKDFSYSTKTTGATSYVEIVQYIQNDVETTLESYVENDICTKVIVTENNKIQEYIIESNPINEDVIRDIRDSIGTSDDIMTTYSTWHDYWYVDSFSGTIDITKITTVAGVAAALAALIGGPATASAFIGIANTIINEAASDFKFEDCYFKADRYYAYEDFGPGNPAIFYTKYEESYFKKSDRSSFVGSNERILRSSSTWY